MPAPGASRWRWTRGGVARIEVTDDGHGMSPDALALAVQRHCTSKLADDHLIRIETLGFRGEALPSIGAAARLAASPPAWRARRNAWTITVEGGVASAPVGPRRGRWARRCWCPTCSSPRRPGATSSRSPAGGGGACRGGGAPPGVCRARRRHALQSATAGWCSTCRRRTARGGFAALLGPAAAALLPVEGARDGLAPGGSGLRGPMPSRATTAAQALVVNGRPVLDPVLRTAIRVAYRDVIAAGRHAVVALYLTIPPDELDVNVHPGQDRAAVPRPGGGARAGDRQPGAGLGGGRAGGSGGGAFAGLRAAIVAFGAAARCAWFFQAGVFRGAWQPMALQRGAPAARILPPNPGSPGPRRRRRLSAGGGGGPGAGYLRHRGGGGWQPGAGRPACRP